MSEREIAKKQRDKEKRDQIRTDRLAREAEEVKERQRAYKEAREEELAKDKTKQDEAMHQARVLVELHTKTNEDDEPSTPKPRAKRPRPAATQAIQSSQSSPSTVMRPLSPSLIGPVAPRLDELRSNPMYSVTPMPMPDEATVTSLATMRVLYADATHGMGLWGDASGRWAKPQGWWPVIENLNKAFTYYGQTDKQIVMGEYNAVFIDCVQQYCDWLPELKDPEGNVLSIDDVVFRITRPDVEHDGVKDAPCRHRYKTLREQADEMYYSLHGAANGYAIPCVAAMIFTGPKVRRKGKMLQLYGSLYVLKKAPVTLSNVLDDHTKHLVKTKKLAPDSPELAEAMTKGARKVAKRVLPVLIRQARLGGIYLDCKPANTLFVEGASVYLSDFDAAMYAILCDENSNWEAHLLISLLLMGTHVRCYQSRGVGEGWAAFMRPLLLDLAVSARGAHWLFEAKMSPAIFVPGRIDTPKEAKARLEMIVTAYFCDSSRADYFKVNPRFATHVGAKPMVHQLLKFVLTGSPVSRDVEVCTALGEEVL